MNTEQTSKNIFTYIKTHYGETILAKIWKLEKTKIKYSSYTNNLRFSLRCHHNKILPKDLQLKSRIKTERSKKILQRAGKLLLQEWIHINYVIRDRLKNGIKQLQGKILESITPEEFHHVEKIHEKSYRKSFDLTKKRHIRKFDELISRNRIRQSTTNIADKRKWVINMSSRQLTHIETDLLAKGLNFSITSKTLPNKDIIATIEDAVKDLEKEEADTIRAKVSLTLLNSKPPKDNLSKDERKALKELQSDTSIGILPADKGRSTVILNREDYLEKCMDHINNGPYQLLRKDPTTKMKAKTLTDGVAMGSPASSTTAEIYMQAHESTAISTVLHPSKVWERFVDDVYSIVKRTQLENFFHHINNLHQNIKFTMEEESNGELAFLDTLLKRNNGEISVLVYRKPTHTDQYLHYSSHHQTSCKKSVVSSLFNRAHSIITNKDDLHKENAKKYDIKI